MSLSRAGGTVNWDMVPENSGTCVTGKQHLESRRCQEPAEPPAQEPVLGTVPLGMLRAASLPMAQTGHSLSVCVGRRRGRQVPGARRQWNATEKGKQMNFRSVRWSPGMQWGNPPLPFIPFTQSSKGAKPNTFSETQNCAAPQGNAHTVGDRCGGGGGGRTCVPGQRLAEFRSLSWVVGMWASVTRMVFAAYTLVINTLLYLFMPAHIYICSVQTTVGTLCVCQGAQLLPPLGQPCLYPIARRELAVANQSLLLPCLMPAHGAGHAQKSCSRDGMAPRTCHRGRRKVGSPGGHPALCRATSGARRCPCPPRAHPDHVCVRVVQPGRRRAPGGPGRQTPPPRNQSPETSSVRRR